MRRVFLASACILACAAPSLAVVTHRSDNPVPPLVIGLLIGLASFWGGFWALRRRRLIENIPTSKIRSMAIGLVEVKGTAVDRATVEAPFTGHPCVFYKYRIQEYRKSGKRHRWETLKRGDTQAVPFVLSDETGETTVRPQGSEVDLAPSYEFTTGMFEGLPERVDRFAQSVDLSVKNFLGFQRKLRFTEWSVKPGQNLYVMGECQTGTSGTFLGKPGASGGIFLISDKSEKSLVGRYGWGAFAGLSVGVSLMSVCVVYLIKFLL